jgi:hypothetical protein
MNEGLVTIGAQGREKLIRERLLSYDEERGSKRTCTRFTVFGQELAQPGFLYCGEGGRPENRYKYWQFRPRPKPTVEERQFIAQNVQEGAPLSVTVEGATDGSVRVRVKRLEEAR